MDDTVLKNVCKFLRKQKNNEAIFQAFWEGTKELYPSDLSKTKVKAWLKEHPERFEIIKGDNGNPFGKIKLKVEDSSSDLPATTKAEDIEIAQKLIESIDNKGENGHLYAIICKNKSQIFPEKLQDKKHIRKWVAKHENWFQIVNDSAGGLHSLVVLGKARHLKTSAQLPHAMSTKATKKASQNMPTPRKAKEESKSDDLLKLADDILLRISEKIAKEGGIFPFESLYKAKNVIGPLGDEKQLRFFLEHFPQKFEIINVSGIGEWVQLKDPNNDGPIASSVHDSSSSNDPISKVINFIFENGGTVPFENLLKDARNLIGERFIGPEALSAWLNSNVKTFEVVTKPDNVNKPWQVKVKLGVTPRFCQNYISTGQCPRKRCQFLHICKAFICQPLHANQACNLSHNIRDTHNKTIVDKMGALGKERNEMVVNVLRKSYFPRVCSNYNKGGCPRGDNCHFLHVCGNYILNQCESKSCSLSHNVVDCLHNINLLKKYELLPSQKLSIELVKANIAFAQVTKPQSGQGAGIMTQPKGGDLKDDVDNIKDEGKKKRHRTHGGRTRRKSSQASSNVDTASIDETYSSGEEDDDTSSPNTPSWLSFANIQKSNLASSLSGQKKVESWMGIPGFSSSKPAAGRNVGWKTSTDIPDSDDQSDSSSSYGSHASYQSSISSSQSSVWLDDSVKKVFIMILDKYNGEASFKDISKESELFGHGVDVVKWFESHQQKFILHRNGQGKIDSVSAFSQKARICLDYGGKRGCVKAKCGYLHICRSHIESHCPKGKACPLNHNLNSDQVTQAVKRMGLENLSSKQLAVLIRVSLPSVCNFYNNKHCNRGAFCPNLHVCKGFVKGRRFCKDQHCSFGHEQALKQGPAVKILKMYKLYGQKPNFKYIRKMIFEPRKQSIGRQQSVGGEPSKAEIENKPKPLMEIDVPATQKIDNQAKEIKEVAPDICIQFLLTAGQCPSKKCSYHHYHHLPYCWQYKISGSSGGDSWKNFKKKDCENIEKYFCDVNLPAAELNISTKIMADVSSVRLDFQSFSGHPQPSTGKEFQIRRLQCQQGHEKEAWYATKWIWYELKGSAWIESDASKGRVYEELFSKGNSFDWSTFRRRPVFMSEKEVNEKKRSSEEQQSSEVNVDVEPLSTNQPAQTSSEVARENISSLPEVTTGNFYRTRVEPDSADYEKVKNRLGNSVDNNVDINLVDKIVSEHLWEKYKSQKKAMTDELRPGEHLNEADLFIPCLHEDLDRIMKGNVEDSRIVLHDKPLGRGYYFTSKASLCMQWCKEHLETSQVYLIMCQVLLGTSTQGSSDLAEFPRRPDGRPYDSLVDKKSDPSVFVIKNIDQCYPAFVINFSYKTTETPSQDFLVNEEHYGLTSPIQSYQETPPSYQSVSSNHPLSSTYTPSPQSTGLSSVAVQQPSSPQVPVDYVKVAPPYSEVPPPSSEPPPQYTPHPQRVTTPVRNMYPGNTGRIPSVRPTPPPRPMPPARPSGDSRDKKDCLVM